MLSGHLNMFTRKRPTISQTNAGFASKRCVIRAIYKPQCLTTKKAGNLVQAAFKSCIFCNKTFFSKLERENIPSQNLLSFIVGIDTSASTSGNWKSQYFIIMS